MWNKKSKERFRNEWKYLISTSEKELLEMRMRHILKKIHMPEKMVIQFEACILRIISTVRMRRKKQVF